MLTHKRIDLICCVVLLFTLIITACFVNGNKFGLQTAESNTSEYENLLFDTSSVHTINIVMDDWDAFLETCENEEYNECTVEIDGESFYHVGIRAKGNTSLRSVAAYGNDRYSFKIEFDCYDDVTNYHGLDKISLNNIIQDNTYLKDYLCYQMMRAFGAPSPLCSFVYITVNGEDWGLYLAVEGIEESFLERNYGSDYGELYKPDSTEMGGGRGNGQRFDMQNMPDLPDMPMNNRPTDASETNTDVSPNTMQAADSNLKEPTQTTSTTTNNTNDTTEMTDSDPPSFNPPNLSENAEEGRRMNGGMGGMGDMGGGMSMSSDDVLLKYIDDSYDSYLRIFDNAKTNITDADKDRLIASLKQLSANENIEKVVDVDDVIRYFVVHNFVCNFDSYTGSIVHNYYLYEKDGMLSMLPWDYNLAFGGFQSQTDATGLVNYPIDTPVSGLSVEERPMLAWIFADETYTEQYHAYFSEFLSSYFENGYFETMITETSAMIAPYVEKDPTKFCTYDEFLTGVENLKEFCLLRAESIRGQLDGTIPSTQTAQQESTNTLIDASAISIEAMGSMGNTRGNQPGGMPPDMPENGMSQETMEASGEPLATQRQENIPPNDIATSTTSPGSSAEIDTDAEQPSADTSHQDVANTKPIQSTSPQANSIVPNSDTAPLLIGGSLAVLVVGLVFAICFKR